MAQPTTTTATTPPRGSGGTSRGKVQKEALLRAAFDLIAERGFEGLRTRDIASRAGVNVAMVHYYFATKEDLIRAVVDSAVSTFRTQEAPSGGDPAAAWAEYDQALRRRWQHLAEWPELAAVMFELSARATRDPELRVVMAEMYAEWRARLETYLRAGVERGLFRRDLDVAAAAVALVAWSVGGRLQAALSGDESLGSGVASEIDRWLTRSSAGHPGRRSGGNSGG